MIRSAKLRIAYQTCYCILAVVGFLAQLGVFQGVLNRNYLVYYTNLSNLLCMVFGFFSLAHLLRGGRDFAPALKFVFSIMILVTFILYNGLLANYSSIFAYFSSLKNGLNHGILPVLFVLDWVLFYERGKTKWTYPLLSIIPPALYVAYILIRAAILDALGRTASVVYPYYFLDLSDLGWGGFLRWMGMLLAGFLALGYVLCALDHLLIARKEKAGER